MTVLTIRAKLIGRQGGMSEPLMDIGSVVVVLAKRHERTAWQAPGRAMWTGEWRSNPQRPMPADLRFQPRARRLGA